MTREEAIKELEFLSSCSYVDRFEPTQKEALKMAIEVLRQEPKSGRWIYKKNERNSFVNVYTCSVCGWKRDSCRGLMQDTGHNLFCEHCGAKMIK